MQFVEFSAVSPLDKLASYEVPFHKSDHSSNLAGTALPLLRRGDGEGGEGVTRYIPDRQGGRVRLAVRLLEPFLLFSHVGFYFNSRWKPGVPLTADGGGPKAELRCDGWDVAFV